MNNLSRGLLLMVVLLCIATTPDKMRASQEGPDEGANAGQASKAQTSMSAVEAAGIANSKCYSCHADPDLRSVTPRGQGLNLLITPREYSHSVHGGMSCVHCHTSADGSGNSPAGLRANLAAGLPIALPEGFEAVPHKLDQAKLPVCMNCHEKTFAHIKEQTDKSQHYVQTKGKITCADCHNPHKQQRKDPMDSYAQLVAGANKACIDCHTSNTRFKIISGKAVYTQNISHEFLPEKDKHFNNIRCVECHTPADGSAQIHYILPKKQALRDCARCHTEKNSFFFARVSSFTDVSQGSGAFLNKGFFDDKDLLARMQKANIEIGPNKPLVPRLLPVAEIKEGLKDHYIPGTGQTSGIDRRGGYFLLAVLGLCLVHGLGRLITHKKQTAPADTNTDTGWNINSKAEEHSEKKVKLYPVTVRLLHWTNAGLFIILALTGFSIHFSSAALSLPLDLSIAVHDIAGIMITANFLVFLLYSLLSGDIRQYLPPMKDFGVRISSQMKYYLFGIFRNAEKPHTVTPESRLNPVQQVTYFVVYILGMPLLIASGLLLLVPDVATMLIPYVAKTALAAAHYILAVGYLGFLVAHLYLCSTGKRLTSLLKGMLTGYGEH